MSATILTQGSMKLLPPPDGHCRICAVEHGPEEPHNAQSLFYLIRFKLRYGREATWADAIAHCSPEVQAIAKAYCVARSVWSEPPRGVEIVSEPIDG